MFVAMPAAKPLSKTAASVVVTVAAAAMAVITTAAVTQALMAEAAMV